jgi:hypothetical protein
MLRISRFIEAVDCNPREVSCIAAMAAPITAVTLRKNRARASRKARYWSLGGHFIARIGGRHPRSPPSKAEFHAPGTGRVPLRRKDSKPLS